MKINTLIKWSSAVVLLTTALPAFSYIGPGAGAVFFGSLFSAIAVFFVSLFAVLMWPLRRLWRRLRNTAPKTGLVVSPIEIDSNPPA